jgi:DNA-binding CsgD family transcriptional regulator
MGLVTTLLDELGIAVCIFATEGRELHRSPPMRDLLSAEPEAASLLAAMRIFAGDELEARPHPTDATATRAPGARLAAWGGYRLRAVGLPPGEVGPGPSVIVEVERNGPPLPHVDDLVARCGLTRREAEVALLLARGGSDREMARALGVSPHTIRKHTEHIFDKLRLHSRKAFVLRLSDAARPMPSSSSPPKSRARAVIS